MLCNVVVKVEMEADYTLGRANTQQVPGDYNTQCNLQYIIHWFKTYPRMLLTRRLTLITYLNLAFIDLWFFRDLHLGFLRKVISIVQII